MSGRDCKRFLALWFGSALIALLIKLVLGITADGQAMTTAVAMVTILWAIRDLEARL